MRKRIRNFFTGMARTLDIGATQRKPYYGSERPEEIDYKAMKSDWEAVGNDIRSALNE